MKRPLVLICLAAAALLPGSASGWLRDGTYSTIRARTLLPYGNYMSLCVADALRLNTGGWIDALGDRVDMGTSASYVGGIRVAAGRSFNVKLEQNTGLDLAGQFVVYSQAEAQQLFAISSGFSTSDGYAFSTYPLNIGFYEESYASNALLDGLTGTHAPFAVFGVGLTAPRLTVQDTCDQSPLWLYDNSGTLRAYFGARCSTAVVKADSIYVGGVAVIGIDTTAALSTTITFANGRTITFTSAKGGP